MRLRHATPRKNLKSIRKLGLLTSFSRGALPLVWFHAPRRSEWAILHTEKRHECEDVVVIEVSVPRKWLTRNRWGLWTVSRDIPAKRIGRLVNVQEENALSSFF